MDGWVCLYRKILEWQWYSDVNVRLVFIHLLLTANYKENKWKNICVKRGQLITSYSKLAKDIGISVQQTRTALTKLKSTSELTIKSTNKYILVTIENYDFYQTIPEENNNQNNKQITNNQQTNNKQITTNNNNNNKTNNNNIYIYNNREGDTLKNNFHKPTIEEINQYCTERANKVDPQRFFDYYQSNGWKVGKNPMKDWKACIRRWEKSESQNLPSAEKNDFKYQNYEQRQYEDLESFYDNMGG